MVRAGSFAGPAESYGSPLSVVKPPDNDFALARWHRFLLDMTDLTKRERRRLQDEIDAILGTLQVADEAF